jgi:ABC-type histidine transport system ATPase subunit
MKLRSSRIKLKKSPILEKLNMQIYNSFKALNLKDKISAVKSLLNRPIRVCGMVKNEGGPGGGPYWVYSE